MRAERERRKISIGSIAESTKILGALLEGLENDDVSRWPTGLYRRAFMRAYATAIGVDADAALKEFLEQFPEPEDVGPAPVSPPAVQAPPSAAPVLHVQAPVPAAWFADGALVKGFGARCFAVAVDLFVVSAMGLALFVVLGTFWAPAFLSTALYYSVSILVLGNTPGVCLFADPAKWNARMQRFTVKGFTGSLVHRLLIRSNS